MRKLLFATLLFVYCSLFSQENDPVTSFFDQYLTTESQFKLIEESIPSLEECQLVFEGDNAKVYFEKIQSVKKEIQQIRSEVPSEQFARSSYERFTSNDAKSKDKKNSFGMHRIAKRLKPSITFYLITYEDEQGKDSKFSPFKFFVNLNGKWLFFPKPTKVFMD